MEQFFQGTSCKKLSSKKSQTEINASKLCILLVISVGLPDDSLFFPKNLLGNYQEMSYRLIELYNY